MKALIVRDSTLTRHEQLKQLWCNYNGQRGTPLQRARVRLSETDLDRMLTERNIFLEQ